jgi:hypothetical protein
MRDCSVDGAPRLPRTRPSAALVVLAFSLAFTLAATCGCRPPAVEFENLHLVASLRTACSAQKPEWLEGVAKAVEMRHSEGEMSDAEREHFVALIEIARRGEWQEADRQCLAFEKAQLGRTRE